MEHPQNFNAATLDSIRHDVMVVGDDQLPCACNSSGATQMRMLLQLFNTSEYMHEKGFGVGGTFFRNVIGFVCQVGQRSSQPLNLHTSLWLLRDLCQMQTLQNRLPSALV